MGIGEWPVARQATFSLWRDTGAVRDFAYTRGPHAAVITRTRQEGWFGEECFARFVPYASGRLLGRRRPAGRRLSSSRPGLLTTGPFMTGRWPVSRRPPGRPAR